MLVDDTFEPFGTIRRALAHGGGAEGKSFGKEVVLAEADYERFRTAYATVLARAPDDEVALMMIGADLDRAHSRLHGLLGFAQSLGAAKVSVSMRMNAARSSTPSRGPGA